MQILPGVNPLLVGYNVNVYLLSSLIKRNVICQVHYFVQNGTKRFYFFLRETMMTCANCLVL